MNCKKCGAILTENDQFCKSCGAAIETPNTMGQAGVTNTEVNNPVQQPMSSNMYQQPVQNFQQPVQNFQQPMQQPINNGFNNQGFQQTPKNNKGFIKYILIGLGVVIAIVVAVLLINGNKNGNSTGNTGSTGNNGTGNVTKSTYKVNFKGFTFKIPTDLVYETQPDSILLSDEEGSWATYIEVMEGSFAQVSSKMGQLQSVYQQLGYESSPAVSKNIGGTDFITLEIKKSGYNALLGLAKANSMYMFGATVYNVDNEYDYDVLKTIASILQTADIDTESNSMSTFEKVDMNPVMEMSK